MRQRRTCRESGLRLPARRSQGIPTLASPAFSARFAEDLCDLSVYEFLIANITDQIPAYQAYPPSGADEPRPLPNFLRSSVSVIRTRYLMLLYPS